MEVESHDTERPTAFQRIKQFIQGYSKLLQFLGFFTKETVDTTLDWLLFKELNTQEEGLVFGAVDSWLLGLLCFFCCIGTILTILDLSNRVHELRTGTPFMHTVLPELLTVLLEDIPQLSIGLYLLQCRGQTINPVAHVKAYFLLIGSLFYIAFTLYTAYTRCDDVVGILLKGAVLCLCIVITSISILIIMSTGSYQNTKLRVLNSPNASSSAFDPFSILQNEGKRDLYFARVGIYGDTCDLNLPVGYSGNTAGSQTWMKFFEIYDIMKHGEITINIITDANQIRVQILNSEIPGNGLDKCYRLNKRVEDDVCFTEASHCVFSNGTKWHYRFKYIQPSMRYLIGDIQYNVRKIQNGSCDDITLQSVPHLKYFRAKWNTNLTGYLYGPISLNNMYIYTTHSTKGDLIEIDEVWRTGISEEGWSYDAYAWKRPRCATGGVTPHFNPDINMPCYP